MFKSLLVSMTLLGTFAVSANTVEMAQDLYSKRGEDVKNAKEAAKIYGELAAKEADKLAKAKLLISQSEATYYVGTQAKDKKEKRAIHEKGYKVGLWAADMLETVDGQEAITERARALYFYGSNIGKWGETKFILKVLKIWKEDLKPRMMTLINKLDDTVEDHGVYRIVGRAFIKVPNESSSQGVKYLEKAFEATKVETDDFTVAKNSTTTRYLLWGYMEQEQTDKFCELYDNYEAFAESDREVQDAVNPKLIPETQQEIDQFLNSDDKEFENIREYYEEEC